MSEQLSGHQGHSPSGHLQTSGPEDSEAFLKRAVALHAEGRLEEACLAARRATELDPRNANAWWQLAMSETFAHGDAAGLQPLETLTRLTPHFVDGWQKLGLVHQRAGRLDEAINCYESALKAEGDDVESLKLLVPCLEKASSPQHQARHIQVLRKLQSLGQLSLPGLWSLAYELGEAKEHLASAAAYEAYTALNPTASAINNLGVAYQDCGRYLDALDAYRTALEKDPGTALYKKNVDLLQSHLLLLREAVSAKDTPYLGEEQWYQHYINPFVLLNAEDPLALREAKVFQKARQALYREIELEEGRLAWMPGLHIDKSSAMLVCEQLNDDLLWDIHHQVLANPPLCEFLMKGHLGHFLTEAPQAPAPTLPHLLNDNIRTWLGPRFAAQYSLVLAKAIEQGDAAALACLFGGRRWVAPAHEELCFEAAQRTVARLCDKLVNLAETSKTTRVSPADATAALQHGRLDQMLPHLPAEFQQNLEQIYGSLREITINLVRSGDDPAAASKIIALGKTVASKSPALLHQWLDDQKDLAELADKKSKSELHLRIDGKSLEITRAGVSFNGQRMAAQSIAGIRWGHAVVSNDASSIRFSVGFIDKSGTKLDVYWSTDRDIEQHEATWKSIVTAVLEILADSVVTHFRQQLNAGIPTQVGPLAVTKDGVHIEYTSWFTKKVAFCPWASLRTQLEDGFLTASHADVRKAKVKLPLRLTYNAAILHLIASGSL